MALYPVVFANRRTVLRRAIAAFGAVLAAVVALVALASPASAHASLVDSSPAPSSVLTDPPEQVLLRFDEAVEAELGGIEVVAAASSERVDVGPARLVAGDDTRVVASLPELEEGTYVVVWRVTSADGHPVRGAFSFQVGEGAATDTTDLSALLLAADEQNGVVSSLVTVTRWLAFVSVALLVGAAAFCASTWPAGASRWPVRRLAWYGWALSIVATVASFVLHGPYVAGRPAGDVLDTGLWVDVAGTRFGQATLLRLALLAAALPLLVDLRRCRTAVWRAAAGFVATLVAVSFAASGHPSTGRLAALGLVADAAHVLAMAVWLGGLIVLVVVALVPAPVADELPRPAAEPVTGDHDGPVAQSVGAAVATGPVPADVSAAVHRFSTVAFAAMVTLVITGAFQSWRLLGGFGGLTDSRYGRLLAGKLVLVGFVVVLAALARLIVRRYWPAGRELRRVAAAEVVVGACILAVTAMLVGTPPTAADGDRLFSTTIVKSDVIADLTIEPSRVGMAELHLYLSVPGGALARVQEAGARLRLAERELGPIPVELRPAGPNHYLAAVQFPYDGDWELELLITTAPGRQVQLLTTVPVTG
jgi:copper transport protein